MIGPILALIPVAAAFSLVLTAIVRAAASRRGWFDTPGAAGHVKREVRRVPNVGGIGIFWAIALPILVVIVAARWDGGAILTRLVPGVGPHLAGLHDQTPMGLGLLGVLLALHLMGLADDRRALGAWPKLLVMALGAGVMVFVFDLRLLTLLDAPVGGRWLSITLTILWFLAVTNAINFIDNMDGLAGGVGVTAGTLFLIAAILGGQWFVAGVLALLVGALLGFLWFNFPWRRGGALIFMGDGDDQRASVRRRVQVMRLAPDLDAPDLAVAGLVDLRDARIARVQDEHDRVRRRGGVARGGRCRDGHECGQAKGGERGEEPSQ